MGLGTAFNIILAVYIRCTCNYLHALACHVCHGGDIYLSHNGIIRIAAVDSDIGLGSCLAACACDVGVGRGNVIQLRGPGLNVEMVNTTKEHIVQVYDLLVVHGVDVSVGGG